MYNIEHETPTDLDELGLHPGLFVFGKKVFERDMASHRLSVEI